jgi:hypothetical protein
MFLSLMGLVALLVVPLAGAQVTWDSSFTVVNQGTDTATVEVTFYPEAPGSLPITPADLGAGVTNPFTLDPGTKQVIYVPNIPPAELPAGRYSVVISADQQVVAIASLKGVDGTIEYNGSYSGENVGSNEVYMPNMMKNFFGWYSTLSCQNVSGTAQDIQVIFYRGSNTPFHTVTQNVEPYKSMHVDLSAIPELTPDRPRFAGSAVVTGLGGGNVACVDNQTNIGDFEAWEEGKNQEYNGFATGSTTLYCASLNQYAFIQRWYSAMVVQNIGDFATTVHVEYTDGTVVDEDVDPGASKIFFQPDETHSRRVFGAVVTSVGLGGNPAQPLVAMVNAATDSPLAQAQTYNCAAMGYQNWNAPIVFSNAFKGGMPEGQNSAMVILNTNQVTAANVDIIYRGNSGGFPYADIPQSVVVDPGAVRVLYTPAVPGMPAPPASWNGAALVSADQDIIVIINETWEYMQANGDGDFSMSYNPFWE